MFFTYPLELIRVRMAYATHKFAGPSDHRPSFLSAMRRIYSEGPTCTSPHPSLTTTAPATERAAPTLFTRFPILKFYRGFTVTMAGMIPYAGTSFLFWGLLRARFLKHNGKPKSGPLEDLAIGAGAAAEIAQPEPVIVETIEGPMPVFEDRPVVVREPVVVEHAPPLAHPAPKR